ncbi:MAG TPA: sulfotransferase [Acidimicrobiia bacterium]|nr:sulfotransferase [Acidimicrobiia bacterium]
MIVRDDLLTRATELSGLDDVGDVPFLEALDVLVDSFNRDARVDGDVQVRAVEMLTGVLVKRLRLVDDRKRYPGIAEEVIAAPVVIVGQPRSGSTHLHALLACVEGFRAPRFWEMSAPSPPPERVTFATDPRIAAVQAMVDQMPVEMLVRHPMSATRPEQCNLLCDWTFINQAWMASFDIRSYREWFLDADYAPAYEAHRRTLQHLQWHNPGRWVLKYPKHLLSLDALLATYPDAVLIWTHRDPTAVLPSAVSLTGFMRASNTPDYDPVRFAREWLVIEELALHRGLATRDRDDREERHLDVDYESLVHDPVETVAALCERVGVAFDDGSRRAVQRWLDDNPQDQHGVHRYTAAEFGLDADRLRTRFDFYSRRFL